MLRWIQDVEYEYDQPHHETIPWLEYEFDREGLYFLYVNNFLFGKCLQLRKYLYNYYRKFKSERTEIWKQIFVFF
jgi:hypothetical protein